MAAIIDFFLKKRGFGQIKFFVIQKSYYNKDKLNEEHDSD